MAFTTEIAEPDKDGGALRYRGVDIEDLVGRAGHVRRRVGAAGRRRVRPRPAARRAVSAADPHRRRPGRRAGGTGHARPDLGLSAAAGHRRRHRPRPAGPRLGDGAVLRRAVRARHLPARGAAAQHRRMHHRHRTFHDAVEGRAGPAAHRGHRRLLGVRGRARHERLDVHRAGDRLDRRRRGRGAVRCDRRDERPAARRRARPGAADDRGGRAHRRRARRGQGRSSTARTS